MKRYIITRKILLLFILFLPLIMLYGQSKRCLGYNSSPEHQNINCSTYNWQNEKNAIVRIKNDKGECWTGALINTTQGDNNSHHYILAHGYALDTSVPYDLSKWEFYWHYESWNCTAYSEPPRIKTTGAQLVAKNHCSTFVLLELDVDPAEQWDITPYYLGWDRSGEIATGLTLIYHPNGDIKKIKYLGATTTKEKQDHCFSGNGDLYPQWSIPFRSWHPSPTGPDGTGGAPLFNSDHRIIGFYLWGDCDDVCTEKILFGNFSWAWEGWNDPVSTKRLKDWLDPLNTDQVTLNGRGNCQKTIRLQYRQPKQTDIYHAVQDIISKQTIVNRYNITYKAGNSIVLQDGFHAQSGSTFHAQIEELICDDTPSPSFSPQGDEYLNDNFESPSFSLPQSQIPPKINLSPNPNSGSFNIETNFPLTDIAHLKITNLMGAAVYETQSVSSPTIQLQHPTAGTFFVVMILKDGTTLTQKMVIQK